MVGTPAYVAPEILAGEYSEKVDIWSAGVLLHALLLGVLPFQGSSLEACFESIKSVDINFDNGLWLSVSQPGKDLVARMLTRDVSARPSAADVLSKCTFLSVFLCGEVLLPFLLYSTGMPLVNEKHLPTFASS